MKEIVFKRKIYQKMLEWKRESQGETALLIEGARRVGKSTIVREFAKNEYKSYAIFFKHGGGIVQNILYFCALELMPLLALVGILQITGNYLKVNF